MQQCPVEPDETFFVNLSQPTNCTIADGQGVGTIINDDVTSVHFSTDQVTVGEGVGSVQATVTRVGDWEQRLEANKNSFALAFVQRQRFVLNYPKSIRRTYPFMRSLCAFR